MLRGILGGIKGLVFGGPAPSELDGRFYCIHQGSAQCLFIQCTCSINKDQPFAHQLVIKQNEDMMPDDEGSPVEYKFLLDARMNLHQHRPNSETVGFRWIAPDTTRFRVPGVDQPRMYIFEMDKPNPKIADQYQLELCRCIYENTTKRECNDPAQLQQFCRPTSPVLGRISPPPAAKPAMSPAPQRPVSSPAPPPQQPTSTPSTAPPRPGRSAAYPSLSPAPATPTRPPVAQTPVPASTPVVTTPAAPAVTPAVMTPATPSTVSSVSTVFMSPQTARTATPVSTPLPPRPAPQDAPIPVPAPVLAPHTPSAPPAKPAAPVSAEPIAAVLPSTPSKPAAVSATTAPVTSSVATATPTRMLHQPRAPQYTPATAATCTPTSELNPFARRLNALMTSPSRAFVAPSGETDEESDREPARPAKPSVMPPPSPKPAPATATATRPAAPVPAPAPAPAPAPPKPQEEAVEAPPMGELLLSVPAGLYIFNPQTIIFDCYQERVLASVRKAVPEPSEETPDEFLYDLVVQKDSGEHILMQRVCNEMFLHWNDPQRSVIWVARTASSAMTLSLVLGDHYTEFHEELAKRLWETNAMRPFDKAEDPSWVLGEGPGPFDLEVDEEEEEEDERRRSSGGRRRSDRRLSFITTDQTQEDAPVSADELEDVDQGEDANKLLAVGRSHPRSFLVRGSLMDVYSVNDDEVRYLNATTRIKDMSDTPFSPCRVMSHQGDERLLMLNAEKPNNVYSLDVERGKVVEEWHTDQYKTPIREIIPESKEAPYAASTSTFVGMNNMGFFLMDPRQGGNCMVEDRKFTYGARTKPELSCVATTGDGHLVAGSAKGEIRLFDSSLKHRAKTQLPGFGGPKCSLAVRDLDVPIDQPLAPHIIIWILVYHSLAGIYIIWILEYHSLWILVYHSLAGLYIIWILVYHSLADPIIGVDVTHDGRWVLATTATYLILASTELPGHKTGFTTPMGKNKPRPLRLELRHEHVILLGGRVNFTPARFNYAPGGNETSIVTATGPFVVTWDFATVRKGNLLEYDLKRETARVVAGEFAFGEDTKVVVATKRDVKLEKRVPLEESSEGEDDDA
ncbi:putative VID27 cytoplasmic protein [Paratrimastix pyriformis]|uniref:VID27 cytoplasmic protein n=1 Tax=Paratrimastix pyriformis TaxID=342808 RepID=A0ABQ8UDZ0_9EUKA|nr:putative VID27 cytoplasmic protein [Paratrimastix pyriformis]